MGINYKGPSSGGGASITVNDQAASGYIDIGSMRIQWGIATASGLNNITLPAPFANTSYSVSTGTDSGTSAPADNVSTRSSHIGSKTTTSFQLRSIFVNQNLTGDSNIDMSWMAIGLKP